MKPLPFHFASIHQIPSRRLRRILHSSIAAIAVASLAHAQNGPGGDGPPNSFRGGPGGGGPPGMNRETTKLVEKFDKNGDRILDGAERKQAREFLAKEQAEGRGGRGMGRRPGGRGAEASNAKPGSKVAATDFVSGGTAPLYDIKTLRTFFIEFENTDWEKELSAFHDTDVEVPATLTVDGRTYKNVGIHFRGMSSYSMVPEGEKRSLNLSMDFVHKEQNLLGYRTLNLLNSHEDPSFLRSVLYARVAREYIPAPQANLVRVVINGEDWGIYSNSEQFNKEFLKESFGTTKGTRWKAQGSPNGRATFAYLGDKAEDYKRIYSIKTKDNEKAWTALIQLCKVLNETPAEKLEAALAPMLDIDGALKFLALENALINNDGYWIRTSDYNLYLDDKGRFHVLPHDSNETFSIPGGPGFGGGRGGPGGGGRGRGGFSPGAMLGPSVLAQGDANKDGKLSSAEFVSVADAWFAKLDTAGKGTLLAADFEAHFSDVLSGGPAERPDNGRGEGPRGGGPGRFIGPGVFAAVDADKNGSLTRDELKATFEAWAKNWDAAKTGALTEEQLATGFSSVLPRPEFGGRGGGGPGGGGPGGGGRAAAINGVELDPLYSANDSSKPLLNKLLAVPSLRQKYLAYTRDIAEKWLDWKTLGPIATELHNRIEPYVKIDTRKLDSTEAFEKSLLETVLGSGMGPFGGRTIGLKEFADQRRAYLLRYAEKK